MTNNLKYIRTVFGMSLQDLGDAMGGIARQNVARWESGTRNITKDRLEQLSKIFILPERYFIEELTNDDKIFIVKMYTKKLEEHLIACMDKEL
jgi:transcriptional regulator with XRE-family HTH domain